jgi:hypothetical protein
MQDGPLDHAAQGLQSIRRYAEEGGLLNEESTDFAQLIQGLGEDIMALFATRIPEKQSEGLSGMLVKKHALLLSAMLHCAGPKVTHRTQHAAVSRLRTQQLSAIRWGPHVNSHR